MKLRLSARRSDLARLQAYQVGEALTRAHPGLEVEYLFKESLGDKNQHDPLWKMPAQGVFTEDFVRDLLDGRTDLVVHSWKDLPTAPRPGLEVVATLPRADSRDCLLLRPEALGRERLTLLTSSPRRTFATEACLARLLPFRVKEIATKPVRGNILTRLRKLAAGEGDGLFVAKAALDRLLAAEGEEFAPGRREIAELLAGFRWMVLPLSLFPTAPAQGALAIEIREDRTDLRALLAAVHHEETAQAVEREREEFAGYGGGCHQKIGISVVNHPRLGWVEFFHGQPDGEEARREVVVSAPEAPRGSRWPEKSAEVFRRVPLPGVPNPGGALFVARAEALPKEWEIGPDQVVWAAGVRTWEKLAARGVWVNGTSDGLGEEKPRLFREMPWVKLSHADSEEARVFPVLATYRLDETGAEAPPLVDSYFWASESLFRWALAKRPEIRGRQHAAGPGHTALALEKELGRSVDVYYNYAHWRTGHAAD